jgi:CRP-like cAMP-binding protein
MAPARHVPPSRTADDYPRAAEQDAERNQLLKALPAGVYGRLLPHLESTEAPSKHVLWKPDAPIRSVYFPRSCVLSHLVPLELEAPVEAATVGREGFAGVPVLLGADSTSTETLVQVAGELVRLPVAALREVQAHDGALTALLLRYAQALYEQTAQSVACNRRHSLEERCARWLLMTRDRVGADSFALTQEFLAAMLGVRRASVTVAAGLLQQAGLITYRRGRITVLDAERLEEASCECYRVVNQKYQRLLGTPEA